MSAANPVYPGSKEVAERSGILDLEAPKQDERSESGLPGFGGEGAVEPERRHRRNNNGGHAVEQPSAEAGCFVSRGRCEVRLHDVHCAP